MIKSMCKEHCCGRKDVNKDITSTWIASHMSSQLKTNLDMKLSAMEAYIMEKFRNKVPYITLYRAKRKAREQTEGSHGKSYAKLPSYGDKVRERDPETIFKIQFHPRQVLSDPPVFKRMFVYFKACMNGFLNGCRPFIGIDGCHLKDTHGGVLLAAVFVDGNKRLFPVAYGVVEVECINSWEWFLSNIYGIFYRTLEDNPITFMSDKPKGLCEAISDTFPGCHHRWCCGYLYQNFKSLHPVVLLRRYFWMVTKASNLFFFKKAMNEMKGIDQKAYEWLSKHLPKMWSRRAFDVRCKSDHITNNMTKSFNQLIAPFRVNPILTLFYEIRKTLMENMHKKYQHGCNYKGRVTPCIKKKLNAIATKARECMVLRAGVDKFEVTENQGRYVVDLKNQSCGCMVWNVSGIPCKHATACIKFKRESLEKYCDEYYSVGKYFATYKDIVHALPGLDQLTEDHPMGVVQPPPLKTLVGRPYKSRKKEQDEGPSGEYRRRSNTVRCDRGKMEGHNKRRCIGPPMKVKGRGIVPLARQ
ncbi:uncharacterized protein LOC122068993 [Macadamia integrifolia]|uniref:uncharacterized protein LOC122068993 n=1 Tax=Macadamia integrifolia TaxID=60698 RepID=UPI001C4F33B8|nr:uncharacterized protein LOC122068993 [Macadamia integrifolia]